MARLEKDLKDCIFNIESTKITDRKKGTESLKNYLQVEDAIKVINIRSAQENPEICWDSIFCSCHKSLITAVDKLIADGKVKARAANESTIKICASLVTMVATKANSSEQYLNSRNVIVNSLYVLENAKYREIIGERYVKLLNNFILPFRKYWSEIEKFWSELYSISLTIYKESKTNHYASDVISMLNMIIKYGCGHSRVMLDIKKNIFSFMKTVMKEVQTSQEKENYHHQLKVLSLLVTVCQKLQKECRIAVCKFGEEVLEYILPMYPSNTGICEKKKLIFDFLLVVVEAHHPNGADEFSPAAYANDSTLWRKQLQKMNGVAVSEVTSVLRYEKSDYLCSSFLNLIVRVYKQNIHSGYNSLDVTMPSNLLNESMQQSASASKRIRVTVGFPGLIDQLSRVNQFGDMWPWLNILHELLSKYPTLIKENDYKALLENTAKFLSASKDSLVTDYLCKCCIELINIRKAMNLDETNTSADETTLESIWQTVLSTIGLNQSIEWSHRLLQHMLNHLWKPSRGETVLKLYLSGVVRLSNHSLSSLYFLRRRISFPDTLLEIKVWSALIRWMLPEDSSNDFVSSVDLQLYAHTLVLICLRNNVKSNYGTVDVLDLDTRPNTSVLSAADVFTLNSCESEIIMQTEVYKKQSSNGTKQPNCVLNAEASDRLVHSLENDYAALYDTYASLENQIEAFEHLSRFNTLLLHVRKFFSHYGIPPVPSLEDFSQNMTKKLVDILKKVFSSVEIGIKMELLALLSHFFKQLGTLPEIVASRVLEEFYPSLKCICGIIIQNNECEIVFQDEVDMEMKINDNDTSLSLFDTKLLSYDDKLKVEACKVLNYFCYNREFIHKVQPDLLSVILTKLDEIKETCSPLCLLQMGIPTIQTALQLKEADSEIINGTVILLGALVLPGRWFSVEESALVILKFIQETINRAQNIAGVSWEKVNLLLERFTIETESYGPAIVSEVVRCWGLLLKARLGFQTVIEPDELIKPCDKLLSYLQHDFHEVRIIAATYIAEVFKLIDDVFESTGIVDLKTAMLTKFHKNLLEVYSVKDQMIDNESDENVTRPIVVLYSLANAISHSRCARRELLFLLFCIVKEKSIDKGLAYKILELVRKKLEIDTVTHMIRDNSLYLLWSWFKKNEKTFEGFPFEILQCTNELDFYEEYIHDIMPILSLYGETGKISEIADKLQMSVWEITKKCFPEIAALLMFKSNAFSNDSRQREGIGRSDFYNNLKAAIAPKEIQVLMGEELAEVLIELFRNLHDPNFELPPNRILPSPAPCRSDEKMLLKELNSIQESSAKPETPLIIFITSEFKENAQKILQVLYIDVVKASMPEIKLESFQKYLLFCKRLLPYYESLQSSQIAAFICRTIVTNLLHFVSHDPKHFLVSIASLKFLREFASMWLSENDNRKTIVTVFQDFFGGVVDNLVQSGLHEDAVGSEAIATLEQLLKSISALQSLLSIHCVTLEPFPNLPQFENLNLCVIQMEDTQVRDTTLTDTLTKGTDLDIYIKKFLSIVEKSKKCRIESLKNLRTELIENRDELKKLFKRLISKRVFSEECATSLPHRLLCSLLQLTSSEDEQIKYEAACCLGEIGLVDLHSLVLKPNCDKYDVSSEAETLITVRLCHMLKNCLIEKDVDIIVASSEAAYSLFKSPEGFEIKNELKKNGEYHFLCPFMVKKPELSRLWNYFDIELFMQNVDRSALWSPEINTSFESWIENLTCSILASFESPCYLNVLRKICRIKASFAEELFKYLINLLLKSKSKNSEPAKIVLSTRINNFFKNHFDTNLNNVPSDSWSSSRSETDSMLDIHRNKRAVQCLLDAAHFIRLKQREPDLNELNLNYLYAAKAAQFCSMYFTSVLYAEIWINFQIKDSKIENHGNVSAVLEEIANKTPEYKDELLNILREAFSKIGDSDALYGCSSSILLHTRSRIVHYVQTENWPRVMQQCDVLIGLDSATAMFSDINDLSSAIGLAGLSYLQNQYLSSICNLNPALKDLNYEGSWKLGKWDLPEPSDDEKTFAYYQYATLRDIKQGNFEGAKTNLENARFIIIPVLSRTCLESTKNIYNVLSKLQCLQDIEVYLKFPTDVANVIATWKTQDEFNVGMNFKNKEVILHQRLCMLPPNNAAVCDFILDTAKLARKQNNAVFADRCLASIKPAAEATGIFHMKCDLEEAKGLWSRQETNTARYILQNLLKSEDLESAKSFHSKLLRIYGSWLSEINLENADNIYDNYFKPATEKFQNITEETAKERKSRLKTYKCVGEFADSQYQQICKYMTSDDFKRQEKNAEQAMQQSVALDPTTDDIRKTKFQLANQSRMDKNLITETEQKRERYLLLAMEYYLRWLIESDDDLRMFRVISLFVENKVDAKLNLLMKQMLVKVPSYKFIIVLPQLSAHITRNSAQAFGHSVKTVIETCARDHPHHTLPLILSLAKYVKDDEYKEKNESSNKVVKEERVLAACDFMKKFTQDKNIGVIARQMEAISDAYIELAYYKSESKISGETINLRSSLLLSRLTNIDKALCPTISLPISKTATYKDITGIRRIQMSYANVGGINAPKKITCHGTGGEIILQLVKGRDDIRQDAVMQQVFTIMNKLLSENKHTSKRKLLIRTYKVVPLSQRSGVLEWCSNTMALGEYLTEKNAQHPGAHTKYRPQDLRTSVARTRIHSALRKNEKERLKLYNEICKNLKPVFRYFFLEKFPSSTMWFERKLAYTQSVAVTSIVGYIIGLGDRHVQNILIDEKTAEVIHIDFGIAFDQGSLLNYPERIPFRLTRDIEDGMGVFSIDGIFRRCCEQTLTVMRQNKNIIQTTIEVFLYDPLYQWTVTPEKKASVQKTSDPVSVTEVNVTAPRALAGVISKLQGLNEGAYTSIEGQVNRLIQQAKDPINLSLLFSGWQAYL